jgi:putative endonuclease
MGVMDRQIGWWASLVRKMGWRGAQSLGMKGEAYAARFLKGKGMRIISRNRRHRGGEIDLIAIDGRWVVFVEVRTRTSEEFMTPENSIRFGKKRAVTRTVRGLMRRHKAAGMTARIDVVAVIWPEGAKEPTEVRHHKGAVAVAGW